MNLQPKCFKLLQLLSGHYFWANFFALQQAQQILSEKPSSEYLMHASCSIFTWKDWKIGEFSQSPHLNSYQILRHSFLNPFTSLQSNKYSKNLDIYSFTFVCKKNIRLFELAKQYLLNKFVYDFLSFNPLSSSIWVICQNCHLYLQVIFTPKSLYYFVCLKTNKIQEGWLLSVHDFFELRSCVINHLELFGE